MSAELSAQGAERPRPVAAHDVRREVTPPPRDTARRSAFRLNEHSAPAVVFGIALGVPAGVVWGIRECGQRGDCFLGPASGGFAGVIAGMGAGAAVGYVVGSAVHLVRR